MFLFSTSGYGSVSCVGKDTEYENETKVLKIMNIAGRGSVIIEATSYSFYSW